MKVLWTKFSLDLLEEIYIYYRDNVNAKIAKKIISNLLTCTSQLKSNPKSGRIEESLIELNENHRYILRGNDKIIYKIIENNIIITDIFDIRQDPEKLITRNN